MSRFIDVKELQKDQLRGQQGASDLTYPLYRQPIYDPPVRSPQYYNYAKTDANGIPYIPNQPRIPQPHPNAVPGPINNRGLDPLRSRADHTEYNEGIGLTDSEKMLVRDNIGIEDRYIYLDTSTKGADSKPSQGVYTWDITQKNNNFSVKNIIEAEIQEFIIPNIAVNSSYQPSFFYYKTVFMYIESIYAQQYANGGTSKSLFHFEMKVSDEPDGRKLLTPKNNRYYFTMPIRDMTSISVKFSTPTQPVIFQQDTFNVNAVQPADVGPDGDKRFVCDEPHGLTIGNTYAVYFEGFNSTDVALNNIINSPTGQLAYVVDATKIQLTNTPQASKIAITPKEGGGVPSAKIVIAERRVAFLIRLRGLRGTLTNFVNP